MDNNKYDRIASYFFRLSEDTAKLDLSFSEKFAYFRKEWLKYLRKEGVTNQQWLDELHMRHPELMPEVE